MADTYAELLNRGWDEIPESKTLPVGSWLLKGRNAAYLPGDEDKNMSPRVLFFYTPKEPMEDVDSGELAALGNDYDLTNNQIVKTFWIEGNRSWAAVRDHLTLHGIDTKGASQADTFKAFKGTEVVSYLGTKTFTDRNGQVKIDNVPESFAKLD